MECRPLPNRGARAVQVPAMRHEEAQLLQHAAIPADGVRREVESVGTLDDRFEDDLKGSGSGGGHSQYRARGDL